MNYLPLIAFAVVIVLLLTMIGRARRKQAASQADLAERIAVGTDVMTTAGLHGTVVAKNGDGTVQLSIAPGVEVRWELAALRDAASLPDRIVTGSSPEPAAGAAGRPSVELSKDDSTPDGDAR